MLYSRSTFLFDIRIDKCATFGIKKQLTRSIQFQPKLIIDCDLLPAVKIEKTGDSRRYLGRFFDFYMSSATHKSELCEIPISILTKIDRLPLHPKKIALYDKYLLSKLSWHFTVASIPETWVCEHLNNVLALSLSQMSLKSNLTITLAKRGMGIFPLHSLQIL